MYKDLQEAAGLGSPPAVFRNNSSEVINAVIMKQVSYRKTQWPEFVQEMKELLDAQQNKIIHAISGRGRYRLTESFQRLGVSLGEWIKMHTDQRKKIVEKLDSAQLTASIYQHSTMAQPVHVSHIGLDQSTAPVYELSLYQHIK